MKVSVLFLMMTSALSFSASAEDPRPNVVLIMADDMGYECIGVHGGTSYKTPRIDKLAAEGMLFEQCHAQALCTPSRVKIMSGTSNVANYLRFGKLDRKVKTFGHYFQDAGYATAVTGKWQLGSEDDSPIHFGFEEAFLWKHGMKSAVEGFNGDKRDSRYASPWIQHTRTVDGKIETEAKQYPRLYGPDLAADFACKFIEENRERPFFLYYPMTLVHCPFDYTPDSDGWAANNLGSRTHKGDPKYFSDMVAYTDKIVGKIIDKLEAAGLRKNTLVIFTGDNGTDRPIVSMMGDKEVIGSKGETFEWGTHVPFIASWPRSIPKGSVNSGLIDFSDILPTLCGAAGIEVPVDPLLTGRSFLQQLRGEKGTPREWLYCWYQPRGHNELKIFTRSKKYKLYKSGEFFDLASDLLEKRPLKEAELSEVALEARAKLMDALAGFEELEQRHPAKTPKPGKIHHNDPCPCGSGKKYKKCCGR